MSTVDLDALEQYLVDRIACRVLPYVQWLHDSGVTDVEPWLRWSLAEVAQVHHEATDDDRAVLALGPPPAPPQLGLANGTTRWMHDFWRAWDEFMWHLVIAPPFLPSLRMLIGHALDVVTERPASSASARRRTS